MNDSLILAIGVFAFLMTLIGLAITVWEFTHGQPKREEKEAREISKQRAAA